MSCEPFPRVAHHEVNPAFQLFGSRLFNDQTPTEFLVELLLVVASPKRIGPGGQSFSTPLPARVDLADWPTGEFLEYAPKARLNLKLFALMGASRLDSRHETHREHYKELVERLHDHIRVAEAGSEDDVLRTLENLLLGFQGAGSGRTWCAQSFLPICRGVLAGETIWNETAARQYPPTGLGGPVDWHSNYLTMNKHAFLPAEVNCFSCSCATLFGRSRDGQRLDP